MKKLYLVAVFILMVLTIASCNRNKHVDEKEVWYIEDIAYEGRVVAQKSDFKVFDFVFMHFCTVSDSKEEALNKAHLYSVTYEVARKNYGLTKEEKEEILKISDELTKDNAELYLNKGFETVLQYKLFTLMENTIKKYKSEVFKSYNISEQELTTYYNQNVNKYRRIALQVLFYSLKDENSNPLSEDIITDKIDRAKSYLDQINSSEEMDSLIMRESEDPAVIETGGKLTISVEGYQNKEDEIYKFSSNPNLEIGDMVVVVDEFGIYLIRCDGFDEYANSEDIRGVVYDDYCNIKFNEEIDRTSKQDEYILQDIKYEIIDIIATQHQLG